MMRQYPEYREAADIIIESGEAFFDDQRLSELLEAEIESDKYRFRLMELKRYLLIEHDMDFIRWKSETKGKGYKIATSSESLNITAPRLENKIRNTVRTQSMILGTIKRKELAEDESKNYDRSVIKNSLLFSFLKKTPLQAMKPGISVRVDSPKLIKVK